MCVVAVACDCSFHAFMVLIGGDSVHRSLDDGMDPYFFVRLAGTIPRMYLLCTGSASTDLASLCHDHCHGQDWMFAPWFGAAPWMTWSPLGFSLQTHRFVRVQDIDFSSLCFVSLPAPSYPHVRSTPLVLNLSPSSLRGRGGGVRIPSFLSWSHVGPPHPFPFDLDRYLPSDRIDGGSKRPGAFESRSRSG